MASNILWVYAANRDDVTPRFVEVVYTILEDIPNLPAYEIKQFDPNTTPAGSGVLVFGNTLPNVENKWNFFTTYSPKQVMSRGNAGTIVSEAIRHTLGVVEDVQAIARAEVEGDGENWCVVFPAYTNSREGYEAILSYLLEERSLDFSAPIAIDIETGGQLEKEHTTDEVWPILVTLYDGKTFIIVGVDHKGETKYLMDFLSKFEKPIYHNGKFDTRVLNAWGGKQLSIWFDTMLAHHVLNQNAGEHGLKILAQRYFNAEDWDADIKKHLKNRSQGYEQIPRPVLSTYAMYDVFWTYKLYELFSGMIEADDAAQSAFAFEMALSHFLLKIEQRGIPMDDGYIKKYHQELVEQQNELAKDIKSLAPKLNNINSPAQIKQVYKDWGIELSGTSEEVLTELVKKGGVEFEVRVFTEKLLEYRVVSKRISTYINGWTSKARNGRVHPTYLIHGTSTGRLSSKNPNAQNMPRDKSVRKIVGVTEPGKKIVNIDFSQAELRVMAVLSKDPWLINALQEGAGDFFEIMMDGTFGEGYSANLKVENPVEFKEVRTVFKSVVYGLSFGRGATAIAQAAGVSKQLAQSIIDTLFRNASLFAEWREKVMRAVYIASERDFLTNVFGRRFQAEIITPQNLPNRQREALSFLPQSTASDLCLYAAMAIDEHITNRYGENRAKIINMVHDAIMFEVDEDIAEEIGKLGVEIMRDRASEIMGDTVPFLAEYSFGTNWGELD